MFHLTVPETPGFPILWWLWWFGVAFIAYTVFLIWLWKNAHPYDDTSPRVDSVDVPRKN